MFDVVRWMGLSAVKGGGCEGGLVELRGVNVAVDWDHRLVLKYGYYLIHCY